MSDLNDLKACTENFDMPADEASFAYNPDFDPAASVAYKNFGIKYLYPWQRLVIANILDPPDDISNNSSDDIPSDTEAAEHDTAGNSEAAQQTLTARLKQIVLLPTGAGKSLCFLIPALLLEGPTLILYPLLALMSDQARRMSEGGMTPVLFYGNRWPSGSTRQ